MSMRASPGNLDGLLSFQRAFEVYRHAVVVYEHAIDANSAAGMDSLALLLQDGAVGVSGTSTAPFTSSSDTCQPIIAATESVNPAPSAHALRIYPRVLLNGTPEIEINAEQALSIYKRAASLCRLK